MVYELPAEEQDTGSEEHSGYEEGIESGKFVKLMVAGNEGEIAFLRSILDTTDIPYYFQSLAFRISGPEQAPANLMIEETRLEEARELLKDFKSENNNFQEG